jgi:hypothetical protein
MRWFRWCAWFFLLSALAPAFDATQAGRQLTTLFYAGDVDRVWAHLDEGMRSLFGTKDKLQAFREQVARQLGTESEVMEERARREGDVFLYERIARFSRGITASVRWAMRPDGIVAGLLVRPVEKEAESRFLDYQTKTPLHLPFAGEWTVFWGGRTLAENHHAVSADQRFAYDLLVSRGGSTHRSDGTSNDQFYCFGQPILAPAAGSVVAAHDGVEENRPGVLNNDQPLGNFVILDHGNGEFSFLVHLQRQSVRVHAGETIAAGAALGRCGNSGRSTEPHLHYHLQNSGEAFAGDGLPAQFQDYVADGKPVARGEPHRGQLIRSR